MSTETRFAIANDARIYYTAGSQKIDLLNPRLTNTYLIALLDYLLQKGYKIGITSVRSDHHDDGPHGHAGGFAFDGWPCVTTAPLSWMDAADPKFQAYLVDLGAFANIRQIGLAGTADTQINKQATGLPYEDWSQKCVFSDTGDDHIHHGVSDGSW